MPTITITLKDTPAGGIAMHHNFEPRAGAPCSRAQSAALEIINRTSKEYGLEPLATKFIQTTGHVDALQSTGAGDRRFWPLKINGGKGGAIVSANSSYQFKAGMALVIAGPQASGKTTLARKIAEGYGQYQEIQTGVTFGFAMRDALNAQVKVLIIDGYPTLAEMQQIKQLVTNPQHTFRKPFSDAVITAPSPLVIICVQDLSWLPLDSRHFDVIDLSMGVAA